MNGLPQAEREQAAPLTRRGWATVVAGAILDIIAILVTIAAVVVLTLNDGTDLWWWAVGLASVLAVFTTALLILLAYEHRSFIKASKGLAGQLERMVQEGEPVAGELYRLATMRRNAAQASGHLAVADQLTIALTIVQERQP
jgi:hypothetical protein